MFINHPIPDIFDYICAQNAQCWARITKSDMEIQRYNRLKIVLAEKERTGTWLSEQMGHSISTVSRWMTNKVQPSVEQALRDCTPPRRGCEGIISVVEISMN